MRLAHQIQLLNLNGAVPPCLMDEGLFGLAVFCGLWVGRKPPMLRKEKTSQAKQTTRNSNQTK